MIKNSENLKVDSILKLLKLQHNLNLHFNGFDEQSNSNIRRPYHEGDVKGIK